jgi:hypothetical protein
MLKLARSHKSTSFLKDCCDCSISIASVLLVATKLRLLNMTTEVTYKIMADCWIIDRFFVLVMEYTHGVLLLSLCIFKLVPEHA